MDDKASEAAGTALLGLPNNSATLTEQGNVIGGGENQNQQLANQQVAADGSQYYGHYTDPSTYNQHQHNTWEQAAWNAAWDPNQTWNQWGGYSNTNAWNQGQQYNWTQQGAATYQNYGYTDYTGNQWGTWNPAATATPQNTYATNSTAATNYGVGARKGYAPNRKRQAGIGYTPNVSSSTTTNVTTTITPSNNPPPPPPPAQEDMEMDESASSYSASASQPEPTVPTVETAHVWGAKKLIQQQKHQKKRTQWGYQFSAEEPEVATPPKKKAKVLSEFDSWPLSLRNYVERAFAQGTDPTTKLMIEEKLRSIITNAIKHKKLYNTNWDTRPLPSITGVKYKKSKFTLGLSEEDKKSTSDETDTGQDYVPVSDVQKLTQRQRRFNQETTTTTSAPSVVPAWRKQNRKKKLQLQKEKQSAKVSLTDEDFEGMAIVGTCEVLEKPFLRLTQDPDPALVRPEHVLKKALQLVKEKWRQTEDWAWVCEQLKSIRQDLTVQQITNEFTVEVYETHARLCLENHDIAEYNQCQSRLITLYEFNIPGCMMEFTGYRILYSLYEENQITTNRMLAELTREMRQNKSIKHALKVREAIAENNFHRFFQLYWDAPNMGGYVMECVFEQVRRKAIMIFTKVFRPSLEVEWLEKELGFEKREDCVNFLEEYQCVFTSRTKDVISCKESFLGVKKWEKEYEEKHRLEAE